MSALETQLFGPGPKAILSLDGGGARGIVSLAFLERMEALLREARGAGDDFRLCDCFNLIGGTSTGAIIATGLALGLSVAELVEVYLRLSHRAFVGQRWHGGLLVPKFRSKELLAEIRSQVGDRTLGSDDLRTGLAIVAKRMDTGSPWIFHNNPRSRYFEPPADDPGATANRDFALADILRASTAAPTYFRPEQIRVAEGVEGLFVDGGVTPYNNPALLLLVMATSRAYGYGWPTGAGRLRVVSVGTGRGMPRRTARDFARKPSVLLAVDALQSVMEDANWQAQAVLQWLGVSAAPWIIDSEAGTLADESPVPGGLLTFQRYELMLEADWLRRELGEEIGEEELRHLRAIDRPDLAERLLELGRRAAGKQVALAHLINGSAPRDA